jgi:serine/threonine-protein kinase
MSGMPVDAAQTMALSNNSYSAQPTRTLNAPGGPGTQNTHAVPAYEYAPTQTGGRAERRRAAAGRNTALITAAWILIPILVIAAFIGVGYAFLSSPGTPEATKFAIPMVAGQTAKGATAALEGLGLKVQAAEEFSSDVEKGTVIGTDPEGGTEVAKGDTVTLKVSKGVKQVTVPTVVGLTVEEATQTLEANGLTAQVVQALSNREQEKVFQSKPAAGQKVDENSIVKIYVPKTQTEVPDVTGQTVQDAKATLEAANFKVKVVRQESQDVVEGNVISQSPQGGAKLTAGMTITLVVSSGPPEEQPPPPIDEPTDPTVPTDEPTDEPTSDDPFSEPPPDFGN